MLSGTEKVKCDKGHFILTLIANYHENFSPEIYAPSYSVPQRRVAKDDGPNYANMYASLNITKEHNIYGHRNAQEPEAPACL